MAHNVSSLSPPLDFHHVNHPPPLDRIHRAPFGVVASPPRHCDIPYAISQAKLLASRERYIYNRCHIDEAVTRGVVNVRTVVQQYSSNIYRTIIFGSRYFGKGNVDSGPGHEEIEHVESIFTILNHLFAFSITDYIPWLRWITDFDGHETIIRNAIRTVRKYQDRLIDERVQQWKDGARTKEDDLLDVFINLENPRLTVDQIKAQILELGVATIDNPSNGIEWAMAEMINQPRIFDRAIQELDLVVGKDKLVQESDIPKLNYIKACVREAFRTQECDVASFSLFMVVVATSLNRFTAMAAMLSSSVGGRHLGGAAVKIKESTIVKTDLRWSNKTIKNKIERRKLRKIIATTSLVNCDIVAPSNLLWASLSRLLQTLSRKSVTPSVEPSGVVERNRDAVSTH
nr:valine N-monooxygenase 1-like [Tanacetum cinerariifolium]